MYQTFVIIRIIDGIVHININVEYELVNKYELDELLKCILIILKNRNIL